MKSHSLEKELNKVKASIMRESNEHNTLRVIFQLVFNDLKLASEQEMSSFVVHVIQITDQAREIMRDALGFGIHRSFAIARSHYENIDLAMMS